MPRKVFVVDDHPMMRRGYASLINAEPDLTVCGEAASADEALHRIQAAAPDLVVADISLPGMNGLELTKRLLSRWPDLPILMISMHDEALYAERALQAGARGYLMKLAEDDTVLHAVRRVLDGHIYLSDPVQDRLLYQHVGRRRMATGPAGSPLHALSDRELEVFEMIGRGHATRDIAERLAISPKTVESHRVRIKKKLAIETPTELVRQAMLWAESIGDQSEARGDCGVQR